MFDISFQELIIIAIVGLLVIGPKRLPEALRMLGLWLGRMRRSFNNVRAEIEKEIGMDEIRRQLHNEAVMEEMKRIEREVRDSVNSSASAQQAPEPPEAAPERMAESAGAGADPAVPDRESDAQATAPSGDDPSADGQPAEAHRAAGGPSSAAPVSRPVPGTEARHG